MDAADLIFAGVARHAEMVAAGEVTPRGLVDACLERIERLNPRLNAFRVVFADRARADAEALGDRDGRPLYGVPVAIKDDMDVAGEPTCFGTAIVTAPAAADSEIVRRLRAAGAIVIGKTNVPELTQWPFTESAAFGMTRNPWAADRTPGGSSGGTAAAVAAGLVPFGTGSDGLGSIRIPAACCGLVGLKPQKDRVPLAPKTPDTAWHGLAHYGVLTRSVRDTALALDAVADQPPAESLVAAADRAPGRLRVALSFKVPPPLAARVDREVRSAIEGVGETLRGLGHDVVERDPPYEAGVTFRGMARYLHGIRDDALHTGQPKRLERRTRGMMRMARLTPRKRLERSLAEEAGAARRLERIFDEVDVVVTPTLARPPLPVGHFEGRGALATFNGCGGFVPFPGAWNITGEPALSVPAGWTADGVPLGAQLVARRDGEPTLISLAAQLEAERRWTARRPPIS
ncbi:MAG TPA: amidase [Solirubrobacteraceae bacterium]